MRIATSTITAFDAAGVPLARLELRTGVLRTERRREKAARGASMRLALGLMPDAARVETVPGAIETISGDFLTLVRIDAPPAVRARFWGRRRIVAANPTFVAK